jgi:hypothetical protein
MPHGNETHGDSKCAEYSVWNAMIQRCHTPTDTGYRWYGARGITVCNEWRGPGGYERFFAELGRRPSPMHRLERKKNDVGYQPGNCKWATHAEQSRNRRSNVQITLGGETKCLTDWVAGIGAASYRLVSARIKKGWDPERALFTPPHRRKESRWSSIEEMLQSRFGNDRSG